VFLKESLTAPTLLEMAIFHQQLHNSRVADHTRAISNTSGWRLSVRGSSKQQQIPVRIFNDEILGAPRLLFQSLVKGNASGLKLKKQ